MTALSDPTTVECVHSNGTRLLLPVVCSLEVSLTLTSSLRWRGLFSKVSLRILRGFRDDCGRDDNAVDSDLSD